MSADLSGYSYGGHGSHWNVCHLAHWDCRIDWLERRVAELEEGIREHRETSLKGGIENWTRGDVKLHALLIPTAT